MKLATLIAASIAFLAPQAFAQAKSFEGFTLGANVESAKTTTNLVGTGSDSGNGAGLGLQAQYSIAFNNQFVLGLGATLSTGTRKAGSFAGTDITTKNFTSFDITPGYALSDTLLIYGKISSISLTAVGTTAATGVELGTESVSGIGYGLGVRSMYNKNIYFQAGFDSNRTTEKTSNTLGTFSGSSNVFSLGAGYKF